MNQATTPEALKLWSEEPAARPDRARIRARIGGLHCSLCTGTIERALGRLPGVEKVAVSLTHEQALVEYDPQRIEPQAVMQTLRDIGYTLHDPRKLRAFEEEEAELVQEGRRFVFAVMLSLAAIALIADWRNAWSVAIAGTATVSLIAFVALTLSSRGRRIAFGTAAALAGTVFAVAAARQSGMLAGSVPLIVAGLALATVFGCARHIMYMAGQSLRRAILNQHVLLAFGAFAGLAGGAIGLALDRPGYPTAPFFAVAVMVSTYHLFSEWLSLIVKTRSSQAVKRLLDLQPDTARVVREGGETELPIEAVRVGDLVRIRPGERVPVDGTVMEGHSAVDLSLVTGEPIPVERATGDTVIGGSINGLGTLLVQVTRVGEESFLARVAREVEDARALKPGVLHLVDRVLRVYAPVVVAAAILAGLLWGVAAPLLGFGGGLERAVFAALSVLVMGYPCAVGISAPLSIVRGAGEAAGQGILMRTGEAFQTLRLVRTVVFDKTGTLTEGRPVLFEIDPLEGTEDELLALAAAAEAASEHPLAGAIVDAAFARGLALPQVASFEAVAGRGVVTHVEGQAILVGSPHFLVERDITLGPLESRVAALEGAGRTVVGVASEGRLRGVLALGDRVRPEARATVEALTRAGVTSVLVTGDNERATRRIAEEVGITELRAGLLPGEKAELLRDLQRQGKVAMVGDGINDAPALMQADVGIAMGGGTDIAIDAADVVILNNRLDAVVTAREVSRWSYRKLLQNVALAFLFNGVGIPLAATGLLYPVWAMAAMAISVTSIFFNSLWGRPRLFFDAVVSVGRGVPPRPAAAAAR
ncbi:heavy metal translocating P-type ATPase [Thauera sp. ZXT1-4]|uniref:heavy metal translocating P-type ATPase n=1 Tax=Thauera sp. ZXT1-4 TaxID=3460294 RepID=UPI0040407507